MNELYGAFAASKPDAASLGRRAAELRTQLERTAEDVARQVGVPVSELLRFEHTGEASVELLMGLLEALTPGGRSEEHTSELQSLMRSSTDVFCLQKQTNYKR